MVDVIAHRAASPEPSEQGKSSRKNAVPTQSLGAALRQRREAMGISLAEIEVATRIRQKYLAAIEADEWHLLPGEVVGRGFLRNYSEYLGLEPHEVVDRRRAVTDPGLIAALSTTSSGAELPPERQVDYRPKEVELKDDVDGIQRGEIKLTPVLSIVALAALVALVWWGASRLRDPVAVAYAGVQSQLARVVARDVPTATPVLIGIVNTENIGVGEAGSSDSGGASDTAGLPPIRDGSGAGDESESRLPAAAVLLPTETSTIPPVVNTPTPEPPASEPPTPTPEPPTPEPPTPTPEPPTPEPPTPTPEPPTPEPPTPTPEPLPVVAAACPDSRAVIVSPGVNQVVSGVLTVTGTGAHDALDYYKLEFAPGANASDGFVYFDGRKNAVANGPLGTIDTRNLANGEYTLRITVVDQTGNFPPPCNVPIVVQN
jgi:cytoskeletal protein RodZ